LIPYLIWSLIFYLVVYLLRGEQHTLVRLCKKYSGWLSLPFYSPAGLLLPAGPGSGLFEPSLVVAHLAVCGAIPTLFAQRCETRPFWVSLFPKAGQLLVVPVLTDTMADWGIYFPLGLVFSLHMGQIRPYLQRFKWIAAVMTLLLFILALLDANGMINLAIARFLCPHSLLCY
jgi:hypothetical protein